jgi:hypothetical protein
MFLGPLSGPVPDFWIADVRDDLGRSFAQRWHELSAEAHQSLRYFEENEVAFSEASWFG